MTIRTASLCAILLASALPGWSAMKVLVTVVDLRTGHPVENLKADELALWEDKTLRRIEAAEYAPQPIDVMLVVDTTLAGNQTTPQPIALDLISQIRESEKMALVSYDSSAELVNDFTAGKDVLNAAWSKVKPGSAPRVLDALTAAMEAGFQHATNRRVMLLLTSGVEGKSRVNEREVVRMARKIGVSIFPVIAAGNSRSLFENLARQTGGACFNLRDLQKAGEQAPAPLMFSAMRSHYTLTITGNLGLGEKLRVEVKRPEKVQASVLSLD